MITKKDAINIAQKIGKAARIEIDTVSNLSDAQQRTWGIRGAAFRAVEEIWYDVLPMKTREALGHRVDDYREILRGILDNDAPL